MLTLMREANESNRRLLNYTEQNKEITFCQNLVGAVLSLRCSQFYWFMVVSQLAFTTGGNQGTTKFVTLSSD